MNRIQSSADTLKLAFIPNWAYSFVDFGGVDKPPHRYLRTQTLSQSAGENRANRSRLPLTGKFAGAVMAAVVVVSPFAASAQNDDARLVRGSTTVQTASTSSATPANYATDAFILSDAHSPANQWAVDHPNGVAVSLRLGTDTIPTETIERVLRADFKGAGIEEVAFFIEQGNSAGTGVAFHTDEYVFGPYSLVEARRAIPTDASQIKFNNDLRPQG
ncbi:hypothetical protein [Henriciella sp.]|uniref:hypothetical protein n=1 Tax=Henriciella sp. TaxID=1968823 RepID=UPI0017B1A2F3|nr:hypothetical protein [Henriciella sp.]HIG21763.1 hypothetical protein [Henriciella sp.]